MNTRFLDSINDIPAKEWDALWPSDYPFTRHAFFASLESSGSTGAETGWLPKHLIIEQDDQIVFAMPLFVKSHSYGEYVFDWAWADAYQRSGLDYYPKLLNAIPFTPSCGPRFGFSCDHFSQREQLLERALQDLQGLAKKIQASSFHCLFPEASNRALLKQQKLMTREASQFHWFNQGYSSFDDFLQAFTARKRKMIRKERQKPVSMGIEVKMHSPDELSEEDWRTFYTLYHRTYLKRSGRPGYLGATFFQSIADSMPGNVRLALAKKDGQILAGALYFQDKQTLYGRYWGALEDIDGLHFETCYYAGIEYAIEQGLQRFDPGAQGEHKIQRGFTPIKTCSFHWVAHEAYAKAIEEFTAQEARQNQMYLKSARDYLPFKDGSELKSPDCLVEIIE